MIGRRVSLACGATDWAMLRRVALFIVLAALAALAIHASRG